MLFCICKLYKFFILVHHFHHFHHPWETWPHWRPPMKVADADFLADPPTTGEASLGRFPLSRPNTMVELTDGYFIVAIVGFLGWVGCIFYIAWLYYSNCCLCFATWDAMSVGYDKHVHPIPSNFVPGLKITPSEFLMKKTYSSRVPYKWHNSIHI